LHLADGFDSRHRLGAFDPGGVCQVTQECGAGRQAFAHQFPRLRVILLPARAALKPIIEEAGGLFFALDGSRLIDKGTAFGCAPGVETHVRQAFGIPA
jgi:hypothetical protein